MEGEQQTRLEKQHHFKSYKKRKLFFGSSIVIIFLIGFYAYFFFQSHFLPTTKADGTNIGFLNVEEASHKLHISNKPRQVIIKTSTKQEKFKLPEKYQITSLFLKNHLDKHAIQLPMNPSFKKELSTKLNQVHFEKGTPSQDATIQKTETAFTIMPEQYGTIVNKAKLMEKISQDTEKNKNQYIYNIKDFYQQPVVKKENKQLNEKLTKLNAIMNKTLILKINKKDYTFTKKDIQALLNNNVTINEEQLGSQLTQLNQQFASLDQPVVFTNIHGEKRKYKNNGSYGWKIDITKTLPVVTQALMNKNTNETINATIDGDAEQEPTIAKNYIEIDLNDQKMYCFINGAKTVETDVITGRYNKGTASIPGFHTILYKATNVNLEGQMMDGSRYSVPVKYWMPLISNGGVVTQIGIHDSDHKLDKFGDKEAYKTNAGSNGCINTPGTEVAKIFHVAYEGMPVIIYGNIYDNAPGEFDKPVDYGEKI
ncbi:L,D-transpeptidase family protein [Melissococcus plutonius]|uniref:L,D-transpeptidase family protein n=1 Tax=Melissococcus plutonius TaxID=33970 RepID=UPI003C2CC746